MKTETPRRRSRLRRESSGKRVELAARDIEIFKLLQRYRYLRSTYLYAFVGGKNETRFKERLGALYHDGRYINRPKEQWQFAGSRYAPAVYELDRAGKAVLAELGLDERAVATTSGAQQFGHTLMIAETLASVELGAIASGKMRLIGAHQIITSAPEAAQKAKNPLALPVSITHTFARDRTESASFSLVPDALFGLAYSERDGSKSYRFFALEAERENRVSASSLKPTSFLKKVLGYRDIAARETYRTHLGVPNLLALVVTSSQARIDTMKKVIMDVTAGKGSSIFLFQALPSLTDPFKPGRSAPELFSGPWQRAGQPDFFINTP
ncbi:replication-relaxation family protein [Rhodomicrobium vannielii ATCC 17100]|uniref:replication-relaxation family protein n=1 Tax=Rhodomicrobium vannielii TaxID=1069 RepID=UPI001917AA37|nr:replication-relaxation family protein [Rhodomicrobium vannielii]MBJ7533310.1 replication-relaxation family protein [Rhodomicrobium vannielii ATCC 17100]